MGISVTGMGLRYSLASIPLSITLMILISPMKGFLSVGLLLAGVLYAIGGLYKKRGAEVGELLIGGLICLLMGV